MTVQPGDIADPLLGRRRRDLRAAGRGDHRDPPPRCDLRPRGARRASPSASTSRHRNVLDLARRAERLERHHYVSTAYVAGWRSGRVYETELAAGQTFKNHYESTKFAAEVMVRNTLDRCPRRSTGPRSWWATRAPARRRSSTARTTCCARSRACAGGRCRRSAAATRRSTSSGRLRRGRDRGGAQRRGRRRAHAAPRRSRADVLGAADAAARARVRGPRASYRIPPGWSSSRCASGRCGRCSAARRGSRSSTSTTRFVRHDERGRTAAQGGATGCRCSATTQRTSCASSRPTSGRCCAGHAEAGGPAIASRQADPKRRRAPQSANVTIGGPRSPSSANSTRRRQRSGSGIGVDRGAQAAHQPGHVVDGEVGRAGPPARGRAR